LILEGRKQPLFKKKRRKNLLLWAMGVGMAAARGPAEKSVATSFYVGSEILRFQRPRRKVKKVFLLLFLQKKKRLLLPVLGISISSRRNPVCVWPEKR
jgi:hypothetical protein